MESGQFGSYRIEALIGRGGMGEVYRAYDTEHERTVALKVLSEHLAADRGYRERFRREAHLAARLNEPHVVPIHRYGEIEGRLFLDMRLVQGYDVATVLDRDQRMEPERAISVVSQVALALDAAHADGLVHRDVKPSNVLLTGTGEGEFAYLVDFGIARSTTDSQGPSLTQTGAALGSFDYMAPERFLERPIDHRVDVYALACVLFECLTGRRPFPRDGLGAQMFAHVNTEVENASELVPGLPTELDGVIRRGLAKDPAARHDSAGALAAEARTALRGSGTRPRPEVVVPQAPPTTIQDLRAVRPQTIGFTDPSGGPAPGTGGGFPAPAWAGPGAVSGPGWTPAPSGAVSGPGWTAAPPPSAVQPVFAARQGTGGGFGGPPTSGGWTGAAQRPPTGQQQMAPPAPGRSFGLIWIALATTLVVAVMVVVAVTVSRNGGSGSNVATSTSVTSDTPPTSGPTVTTENTVETSATDALIGRIPADFDQTDCVEVDLPSDGADAAIECGGGLDGAVPEAARFFSYPDAATLDDAFAGDVDRLQLGPVTASTGCPGTQGWLNYNDTDGNTAGSVGCYVDEDGRGIVFWTQDDALAEGYVWVTDGATDLEALWEWWQTASLSDFQVD